MRKLFLTLLVPCFLIAKKGELPDYEKIPLPWFTGPILAPSGNVVQGGHYNIEPYLYAYAFTGSYDKNWKVKDQSTLWSVNPQVLIQVGINEWLDFQTVPGWFWNYREGAAHWEMSDWTAQFDFQLHQDQLPHLSWLPSIRFTLRETVPLGRYRNLQAKNLKTDIGGGGSWVSAASLVFAKLLHIRDVHFLNIRAFFNFNLPAPVHVKGLNAYGGGPGTDGTVYPGVNGLVDIGLEYTLTRNWALAMDIVGAWSAKNRFSGASPAAPTGSPVSAQYSLAPAIEYNWSENLGIIAGSWFTIAGKNVSKFSSAVVAINIYN